MIKIKTFYFYEKFKYNDNEIIYKLNYFIRISFNYN